MSLELSVIAPHVPTICHEDQAPDFQLDLISALKDVSNKIDEIKPDAIVLVSCHWPSTFFHYVDATPVHKGILTATEAPDIIHDVPYEFPGDEELAWELVRAAEKEGLKVKGFQDSHFVWDYGTVVPLRYLTPREDVPVVNLSVTLASTIEETYEWGKVIKKVCEASDKKIVFVASGALSHNLVRGRENMPTASEHALDKQFVEYVMNRDYQAAYAMLPEYAHMAKVESGGRHLAMLFAMLDEDHQPAYLADGQSSGSWNVVMTFEKENVSIK